MTETWHVVYCGDPKRINAVDSTFAGLGIPYLLWVPKQLVAQPMRGKTVVKEKPLFPGYIFIKFDAAGTDIEEKLLSNQGGFFLRGPGDPKPATVSEEEIQQIKILEAQKATENPLEHLINFTIGDKVYVGNGPFLGAKGYVTEIKKQTIMVEIEIFNRSLEVELEPKACTRVTDET